ncbi:MAG: lipid-A-disaccharide synthase [Candidatus Tectomicrobia bacterium]
MTRATAPEKRSLLIVAGETSGDQHGAALVCALSARFPQLHVYGVGGTQMRAAGVQTLFDIEALNAVGAVEIWTKILPALRMVRRLLQAARSHGTRVAVLIDAPAFNLHFARRAKKAGLCVIYYVSPQLWAWRRGRVKKVARGVDTMLTLFPFEVPFYTAAGVNAVYVGHPLVDRLQALPAAAQAVQALGLEPDRPTVALLPGSRRQEIRRLLAPMLDALCRIKQQLPLLQGVLPLAPTVAWQDVQPILTQYPVPVTVVHGHSIEALRAAHVALVASGTATLEAGLIGTPMVVMYKVHSVTAVLARLLIRIPYIGLVNIVAGKQIVPELLQHHVRPHTIATLALRYFEHPEEAQQVKRELARLRDILGPGGGVQRAATHVGHFLTREDGARHFVS